MTNAQSVIDASRKKKRDWKNRRTVIDAPMIFPLASRTGEIVSEISIGFLSLPTRMVWSSLGGRPEAGALGSLEVPARGDWQGRKSSGAL